MKSQFGLGAICLYLVFATVSSSAGAAARKVAKPDRPVWEPKVSSYAAPAIWSGVYAGISAGYGWGSSEQEYNRNDNHGLASTDPSGMLAAATLGYNYDMGGGWLLGAEADLGLMDVSADDKVVYDGHIYKTSFGPWWGTLRARAGYTIDNTLFYGTAGFAMMAVDEVSVGNTPGETAYNKDVRSGWVLGAGIEHAFAPDMTVKLEYLHMGFGRYDGLSDNQETFYFDNSVDLIRTGINYKF